MRKPKKPIPIAPWQAYSQLYFKKRSTLNEKVHADFKAFQSGDQTTLDKYLHLFPRLESTSSVVWLTFYQAVMKDLVKNAGEEELEEVSEYIKTRYESDLARYERPWEAYSGGGGNDSEIAKRRKYLSRSVETVLFPAPQD